MSDQPRPSTRVADSGPGDKAVGDLPTLPYGWWPSPVPAAEVASGKVSRSGLQAEGPRVLWTESRPSEGGRQVVVSIDRSGRGGPTPVDVSPRGVSVRSRVHEYGGGQATVSGGTLFYVDQADQRWYRVALETSGPVTRPVPLTPAAGPAGPGAPVESVRYADGRTLAGGAWLASVEERVGPSGTDHRLVAVATDGSQRMVPLVAGRDFVTAPRPSPDGRWLAWVSWDHPAMPWDRSELWIGALGEQADGSPEVLSPRLVSGGPGRSVGQPHWCRDGSLVFVDDRSGWWLPYRLEPGQVIHGGGDAVPLVTEEAEFHAPDWGLGQSTVAELPDGSLVCRAHRDGRDHLVRLVPPGPDDGAGWAEEEIDQPCVGIAGVAALGGGDPATAPPAVAVLGSTPGLAQGVFIVSLPGPTVRVSGHPGSHLGDGQIAVAELFTADTAAGPVPGLFFPPTNTECRGPAARPPPLVVFCHGGPTAAADPGFDPVVQFFTGRGLAVAVVDYRGSTGYGAAYRRLLAGQWGVADVDDCIAFAAALAADGKVDARRMAIRGSSAGGLTALGALVRSDRFACAVSWYGVTDLEALAADTHAFESRYLDSLVGPWPEDSQVYRDRSPIHHADRITGSVLLLQGADDPVVPPDQSERFAEQLEQAGVHCRLRVFPGEAHGFRAAATIEACLEAELDFYRSILTAPAGPRYQPDTTP